jgi:predicted SAM-dependent methyltransferase
MIEHLYPEQAAFCLAEIHRVLKRAAVVRIAVPDLDQIIAKYDPQYPDELLEEMFEAKQRCDKNRHHWCYNDVSVSALLRASGFNDIWRCEFRCGLCPDVKFIETRRESLFMEAAK